MYIPGHLALGYLLVAGKSRARNQPIDVHHALIPALIGALTPDVVDKSLQFIGLTPYGRTVGHSIFVLAAIVLVWQWAELRKSRLAAPMGWWVAGITSHLIIDLVNDLFLGIEHTGYVFAAWMGWPNTNPDMWQVYYSVENPCLDCYSSLEVGLLALTLVVGITQYRHFRSRRPFLSNSEK